MEADALTVDEEAFIDALRVIISSTRDSPHNYFQRTKGFV